MSYSLCQTGLASSRTKNIPALFQAYMSLVKNQIPGLENVEPTVIEKYVKTLVSLPEEERKPTQPAPKNLNIQNPQVCCRLQLITIR